MQPLIDIGVDFETYYASDYTLRSLTMTEYLNDPRFEIIGVSIALPGQDPQWFHGVKILKALSKIPWDRCRAIMHNAMFDGAILEWKCGYQPAKYLCTMMGSRPYAAPYTGSMSLGSVAEFFKVGLKGKEVENFIGHRYADFDSHELASYGRYCNNDNHLTRAIAGILDTFLPPDEADLIDLTIKKYTRPRLVLDYEVIEARLADLEVKRWSVEGAAKVLGCPPTSLRSREKFADALRHYGVEPDLKRSLRTGQPTYAFAKDDAGMVDLLVHSDPRVRQLAEAKIFSSSTMETKKLERFKAIYDLNLFGRRLLPVPLLYYGAHPGRFSGYDKINLQALTRVKRDKSTREIQAGHLRFALCAPPGYSIVAADLSNIEARMVATLAKCNVLIQGFAQGKDIYCDFATRVYARPITKANEIERFVGKTCILGLGYGMGWLKFAQTLKRARVKMSDEMYQRIVHLYRDTYEEIPGLWTTLEQFASGVMISNGMHCWGPLTFAHESIILPNGMRLVYPDLKHSRSDGRLYYTSRRKGKPMDRGLWGGAICENVCQALARIVITTAELKLARLGLKTVLQAHDELVFCVPTPSVPKVIRAVEHILCQPVPWLPNLPIACEIKAGPSYGDAK
ncbi:MAG: DNA polymerase [Candidatus Binatia bacterium]